MRCNVVCAFVRGGGVLVCLLVCVWLCVRCGVCAQSVRDVHFVFGVVVCCAVSLCVVLVLVLVCNVWCLWCVCAW